MSTDKARRSYLGFAVVGGSGACQLALSRIGRTAAELRLDTPFGKAAPIQLLHPKGMEGSIAFLSRHGSPGYRITAPDVNYRANIWALKEIGTTRIISWSGPGAIDRRFKPGDYVLPDDLIDLTRGRENTFFKGTGLGFIRQSPVFCPELNALLHDALKKLGRNYHPSGVYAVTDGPRLETPAEIRMIARLGGELVGMTLAPEAFLARELEMCYHPCCYVANWAEGVKELPHRAGELFEGMLEEGLRAEVDQAVQGFGDIVLQTALLTASLKEAPRRCHCASSMLRYRRAGIIGEDWHGWIMPAKEDSPFIDNQLKET
ncbi:MAG TPA: MTAP family purine nucleoside phosphorylase [archaeon]|nr:MTAP family purine nucleoside phosphorylase [archaeon]